MAGTFSPLRPPAIPLAVSSPYLNTWLRGDNLPGNWPTFWTGAVTGWQGFVSVDGTSYNWMGGAPGPALVTQTSFEYTATRSIFKFNVANKVEMTATFLSPVYPDDLVKKSLQASYVEVSVVTTDGGSHNVSVYMDVTGEFLEGDRSLPLWWDTGVWNGVHYHRIRPGNEVILQEKSEQPNWGTVFFGTGDGQGMSYQIGADTVVRNQFVNSLTLSNTVDTNFRAVNNNWPTFAFAHNLGNVNSKAVSTLFALTVCQIPVIKFLGASSDAQTLNAPWFSKWNDGIYSTADWVNGYAAEAAYSTTIDNKVRSDSVAVGGNDYAAITTLAVRQAWAGLQPARGATQDYLFLKEISSNSDIETVDVIFPAFPMLAYFNVTNVKLLLDPLYENQENGHYPKTSAIHDLGTFPNAVGYPTGNDEPMPVEECGNMLIMTLSYAEKSGDIAYLNKHYNILQQWTHYLIDLSLIPEEQLSTDDFAGRLVNQTNLALKGIIGIAAMGRVNQLTGRADNYTSIAQSYIEQWYGLGVNTAASPPHTTLQYGNGDSWGLLYNLYADKLLNLNLVKSSIYDQQSNFYASKMNSYTYGVPLDTRHTYTKLDWEAWAAAIASPSVRASFYSKMTNWLGSTGSREPMTDWYETTNGNTAGGFRARPVVGGLFAQLIL
ncbi:DUF1793-domain-containing protein [Thozetella sp. PMI_491]|nr:DUF1793-domain-containing protein [Thozetella sp. PMI_491]